jgi:hypothetical protein
MNKRSILFLFITLLFLPLITTSIYANEIPSTSITTDLQLENLIEVNQLTRGNKKPINSIKLSSTSRSMSAVNVQGGTYLYSNSSFYGKNNYSFHFDNNVNRAISVVIRNAANDKALQSFSIPANKPYNGSLKMTDTNSKFYFEFYCSQIYAFSGWVK